VVKNLVEAHDALAVQ